MYSADSTCSSQTFVDGASRNDVLDVDSFALLVEDDFACAELELHEEVVGDDENESGAAGLLYYNADGGGG